MIKVTTGNNMKRNAVIIDENTTLRQVLTENGIDYNKGMTNLDGTTLKAGDLDKTFKDFGITSECFLLNVVKTDNAAKVSVLGNAMVIVSDITVDDLDLVHRYRPEELVLNGGDDGKEPIFVVTHDYCGSISKYGICFDGRTRDKNGYATLTVFIDYDRDDVKEYVADMYGISLVNLEKLEKKLPSVVKEILEQKESVMKGITVE